MKKVAFQILFDVEDDTTEKDLKDGMMVALQHGFEFGPTETCKISLIEDFVEPPPL
jgi:hypothetical protein